MCFIFLDLLLGMKNLLCIWLTTPLTFQSFYYIYSQPMNCHWSWYHATSLSSCHIISMISLNKGIQFTWDSALTLRMLTSIREFERSTFKFWQLVMSEVQTGKLHPTSHSELSSRQYNHECQTERKEWKKNHMYFDNFLFILWALKTIDDINLSSWITAFAQMTNPVCIILKEVLFSTNKKEVNSNNNTCKRKGSQFFFTITISFLADESLAEFIEFEMRLEDFGQTCCRVDDLSALEIGQIVLVECMEDNKWRRGQVAMKR